MISALPPYKTLAPCSLSKYIPAWLKSRTTGMCASKLMHVGRWSELKNKRFLNDGQFFNIQSTRFFTTFKRFFYHIYGRYKLSYHSHL